MMNNNSCPICSPRNGLETLSPNNHTYSKRMARKKKPLPFLENITIEDVAAEGKAVAHVDGLAVFVPYAVPGDVVDLQVRRKKNKFAEAEIVRIVQPCPERTAPFCHHFGVCGGCKWQ